MKLDATRSSLSGPQLPNLQPSAAKQEIRRCSTCGVLDVPAPIEGEFDQFGKQKIEHLVTIELRYLKANTEAEAQKLVKRGWTYRLHQARHAMVRFVCRRCLRETAVMERDWQRKAATERRRNKETYYEVMCG